MISRYYDINRISYREIQEGMMLSFTYKGKAVHDKNPIIYVLEVRSDRVYGLNLKYEKRILDEITTDKKKELKTLVDNQLKNKERKNNTLKGINSGLKSLGEDDTNTNEEEIEEENDQTVEIPHELLEQFNLRKDDHPNILRNYLPMYMGRIGKLIFKTTNI